MKWKNVKRKKKSRIESTVRNREREKKKKEVAGQRKDSSEVRTSKRQSHIQQSTKLHVLLWTIIIKVAF